MTSPLGTDMMADSFVVEVGSRWPGGEKVLDEDDGFEDVTSSLTSSVLLAAMQDETTQDALLDALSRLEEERARSSRLALQVDLARALAKLPDCSDRPARAATTVSAIWRGRGARARLSAARREKMEQAAKRVQAQARRWHACRASKAQARRLAASRLTSALSEYVQRVRPGPAPSRSALIRHELRHKQQLAAVTAAHASKEAGLASTLWRVDALARSHSQRRLVVERALAELTTSHEALLAEHEALRAEHGLQAVRHEAILVDHAALRAEHATLPTAHLTLQAQHDALHSAHDALRAAFEALRAEHEALRGEHATAPSRAVHESLREGLFQVQQELDETREERDALVEEISDRMRNGQRAKMIEQLEHDIRELRIQNKELMRESGRKDELLESRSATALQEQLSALATAAGDPAAASSEGYGGEAASAAAAAAAKREEELMSQIGELQSAAAVERAQHLGELDEQRKAMQRMEEKLTEAVLAKEQAEELASALLAEKLARESDEEAKCD